MQPGPGILPHFVPWRKSWHPTEQQDAADPLSFPLSHCSFPSSTPLPQIGVDAADLLTDLEAITDAFREVVYELELVLVKELV